MVCDGVFCWLVVGVWFGVIFWFGWGSVRGRGQRMVGAAVLLVWVVGGKQGSPLVRSGKAAAPRKKERPAAGE